MNYSLTLANDSRIAVRRLVREACEQQRRLVCEFVRIGNQTGAKDACEELTTLEAAYDAIRAATPLDV